MWFEDDIDFYGSEQEIIRHSQRELHYKQIGDNLSLIGVFHLHAIYDAKIISDDYKILIEFPEDYPEKIPTAKELENKISWSTKDVNNHINPDGTLCLETSLEIKRIFEKEKNIGCFFKKLLVPYLYRESFLRLYGVEPYPAREHGGEGLIIYYKERFNTNDLHTVLNLLSYAELTGYRGHNLCPCGSNMKIRNCHGSILKEINDMPKDKLKNDLFNIANYISMKNQPTASESYNEKE